MSDHLERRGNGYWYAFIQVPKDLRFAFGKAKRRKALGTTDRKLAKELALQHVVRWKDEFRRLRAAIAESLTPEMIEADLKAFYQSLPEEEPFVMPDGSVEWGVVHRDAETASYAYEHYEPDPLDQKQVTDLKVAVGVATGSLVRLSDYVDGWLDSWTGVAPKTKDMGKSDVLHFVKTFAFANDVKRVAVKNYMSSLNISSRTQNRKLGAIRKFWIYVHDQIGSDDIPNPFVNVLSKTTRDNKPLWERLPFTDEQVRTLYDAAEGQDLKDLIKIAAYTGMRIEEICSKSQVVGDVFEIKDGKTKASNRSVPIHSSLRDGTLERWEATKQSLSRNKYGQTANPLGRRFSRLRDKLDLTSEHTFHCFRHTVATKLVNARPDHYLMASMLLGHTLSESEKNMTLSVYGKLRGELHAELIESLDYGF